MKGLIPRNYEDFFLSITRLSKAFVLLEAASLSLMVISFFPVNTRILHEPANKATNINSKGSGKIFL